MPPPPQLIISPSPSPTPSPLPPSVAPGFSNPQSYDLHRPSYPPSAVSSLLTHLHLAGKKKAQIVEVGAGTGKFTEMLLRREEGFGVIAVEPLGGMRGGLVGKLGGLGTGTGNGTLVVLDGTAARMEGVEDGWGDGVIVAQAFHWFANAESLREIHRVLRPGGGFGVVWNIEDYNAPRSWKCSTRWEQKIKNITLAFDDGQPRFRHQKWKDVFDAQSDDVTIGDSARVPKLFSLPLGEDIVNWTVWLTDDAVWERYLTLSQVLMLKSAERDDVMRDVFEALKGDDVERNEKGEVALHGVTYFAWTFRL